MRHYHCSQYQVKKCPNGFRIEAKEEALRLRNETERELKERRSEISRQERRINQKEENLDRKTENLERKNEQLDEKLKANDALRAEINEVLEQHLKRLEEISGYTAEQAKDELLARVESETRHEMAQKLVELESQFKEEADAKARNLLTLAIQRCAADHVTESTISVVSLPNEEMKGRIIGREGRNIPMPPQPRHIYGYDVYARCVACCN